MTDQTPQNQNNLNQKLIIKELPKRTFIYIDITKTNTEETDKVELLSGIGDNKKEKSQKRNGLLSLIACFIYSIGSNVNFILLDFTVYIISYLKKYDPKKTNLLKILL